MLDAAKAMKLSSKDLLNLKVIDEIIPEPLGGAHRDRDTILQNIKESITKNLEYFKEMSPDEILEDRKTKFLKIGRNDGFLSRTEDLSYLTKKKNKLNKIFKSKKIFILIGVVALIFLFVIIKFF